MYIGGGTTFKKDQALARKYYERGCALGADFSCLDASRMYVDGIGGPKDPALAAKLLARSCHGGNNENCKQGQAIENAEALLLGEGEKVTLKDDKRMNLGTDALPAPCKSALRVDDKSLTCVKPVGSALFVCDVSNFDECKAQCEKGNARSCWNAAANRTGKWNQNSVETGRAEALSWLDKACQAGYAAGCGQQAEAVLRGDGIAANLDRAKQLFEKACGMNDIPACMEVAGDMINGVRGWPKDPDKSIKLYDKTCKLGSNSGCRQGAGLLAEGKYVKKDTARALKLLDVACKNNDTNACSKATTLKEETSSKKSAKK
jgi:TPR repeat protein